MSVSYIYVCDACGKTGQGVEPHPDGYIHPAPPLGWTWQWSPGLASPHACSPECWEKVKTAPDGRLYLSETHETLSGNWRRATSPPAAPVAFVCGERKAHPAARPAKRPKGKPGRTIKPGSLTDITRRVEAIEQRLHPAESTSPPGLAEPIPADQQRSPQIQPTSPTQLESH